MLEAEENKSKEKEELQELMESTVGGLQTDTRLRTQLICAYLKSLEV